MSERTCTVEGCDKRHAGRGYCPKHYQRWRAYGDPLGSKPRVGNGRIRPSCSIDSCDRPNYGHGYCRFHYDRWKRHGDPLWERERPRLPPRACAHCTESYQPVRKNQQFCTRRCATLFRQSDEYKQLLAQGEKRCTQCLEIKSRDGDFYRSPGSPNGLQQWCKACMSAWSAERNAMPEVKRRVRERRMMAKYGLTLADYDRMLADQSFKCLICSRLHGSDAGMLVVDHCHKTGAVRGLLCGGCNSGIGYFQEDASRMASAIAYLGGGAHESSSAA